MTDLGIRISIEEALSVLDYAACEVDKNTYSDCCDPDRPRVSLRDLQFAVQQSLVAHLEKWERETGSARSNVVPLPQR
ncbi:hypothetical protein [Frigidibacter sp. SD6-1]|uniref:hypothetical protein n=1 Tax=Frigidibacter sp. SD6-1 TaxID=3032581 RepID=UPI0024E01B80|nr:hypothetical protein [Frigidibacter sp. SD6-1]